MIEIIGKLEMVKTITGAIVKRNNCIQDKMTGKYYEKNVSCFQVKVGDGRMKWNRIDNGRIGYYYNAQKWCLISQLENSRLLKGFYSTDNTMGWFDDSPEVVYLKDGLKSYSSIPCVNKEIALKLGYLESLWDNYYYNGRTLSVADKMALKEPRIVKYKNLEFNYNAADNNSAFIKIKQEYAKNELKIEGRTHDVSKLLFGKSFGIEVESRNGSIPEHLLGPLGLVPLKDGSLRLANGEEPYEYATVPFYGAKGLQSIKGICEELNKRCLFDDGCSLHIHLGNVKYDKLSIIAYYMLIQAIQEELYSIFPMYKRSEMKYLNKQKDYNAPLPNIGLLTNTLYKKKYTSAIEFNLDVEKYFSKIIEFLTDNKYSQWDSWETNMTSHPLGDTKWNIMSRYKIFNVNGLIFSNTRTIEARIHPGTFNYTKITNWLFICIAIITYAEKNQKDIISRKVKPTLEDILNGFKNAFGEYQFEDVTGSEIAKYLIDYVNFRKDAIKYANDGGDVHARNIEFEADKNFKFNNGVLNTIY
jgi:hypothetical protein